MKKKKNSAKKSVCAVGELESNLQLDVAHHFASPIYLIERKDFLSDVMAVSNEYILKENADTKLDEIYPVKMSGNYSNDERLNDFCSFIGMTAWNVLSEQGYDMSDKVVSFMEMWTQEHYKHSAMEQHTHGFGAQIVGFYFIEVPDNSSRVVFHDPRIAKAMIDLPESDNGNATIASKMINFHPKPGLLIFSNSWLAHSFTRNSSNDPIKFVHFNIAVQQAQPSIAVRELKEVEVI